MNHETYTPGHSQNAMEFMSARTLESHGQFFAAYLDQSHHLLDVGCGSGTITVGLARRVASVQAIDFDASQTEIARQHADLFKKEMSLPLYQHGSTKQAFHRSQLATEEVKAPNKTDAGDGK